MVCLRERRVQYLGRCGGVTTQCHFDDCTIGMRQGVSRIEVDCLLEHFERLLIGGVCIAPKVGYPSQQAVVGSQTVSWPSERLPKPRILYSPYQRGHDCLRHFVLHCEDVIKASVVAFCPDVRSGLCLDQL